MNHHLELYEIYFCMCMVDAAPTNISLQGEEALSSNDLERHAITSASKQCCFKLRGFVSIPLTPTAFPLLINCFIMLPISSSRVFRPPLPRMGSLLRAQDQLTFRRPPMTLSRTCYRTGKSEEEIEILVGSVFHHTKRQKQDRTIW